eukprot:TRINITY_DN21932_c0_g1_i1.p1 TRINITY_DN21932_c0_g1~~TRINITY_DN21932_c0_g1_i1.p1  ORF type:complete len:561 (-),score=41.67 TRINITY_DN21932_c0_g1_i1:255-1709(-)
MASFMSAITILGVSSENYTFGTQFTVVNLGFILTTPLCAYIYLPIFYRLKCNSVYEYLEMRFKGKVIRALASFAFTCQMIMYMGIVLYAPALSLSAITGISYTGSILGVGLCCTLYSSLGGIKAVLITDVFQSLLMFGSLIAVIVTGVSQVGSISDVFRISREGDRLEMFNISPDPTIRHTFWSQFIGGAITSATLYGVNQAQVQRLLTIGSLRRSQGSLWMQWPILACLSFLTSFAGLTMYAYYAGCDPIKSGRISKGDQLLALFALDTMGDYPGLTGLFIAGIFSGSLSTVSSSINSLAAVTLEDYIKPLVNVSKGREVFILKGLVVFYGVLSVLIAFVADLLPSGVLQASLTIFGVVGGPLLGLFSLGMLTKKANEIGAVTGFVSSLLLLFWMAFGWPRPPMSTLPVSTADCPLNHTTLSALKSEDGINDYFYLYEISYAWYSSIGLLWTFIVGTLVSLITQRLCSPKPPSECLFSLKKMF